MTFRSKLLVSCVVVALGGAGLAAWGLTRYARQEFANFDRERSDTVLAQFQREVAQRGEEVANRVQGIVEAEGTLRMALDLSRPQADFSLYANDARGLANTHQLDFLELVAGDGSLISSAQRPGHIGDKNDWVTLRQDWNQQGAFLQRVELADGAELGLVAVRVMHVGARDLYIIGGRRMDSSFLSTVVSPPGMRVLLYPDLDAGFLPARLIGTDGAVPQAERLASIIASADLQHRSAEETIRWSSDPASTERFAALPLTGQKDERLGVLLVGSSQGEYTSLVARIRELAGLLAGVGIVLSIFLSWWVSARVTQPLARLADGTRKVAAGNLSTQIATRSRDEVGQAVRAFNTMTRQLAEQRAELLQKERVAAWREVALRLAHEVKERLFPLQIAVENLRRCREQGSERFEESFFESLATLTAELEKLKTTVLGFSSFAKMPAPHLEAANVNDALRSAVKVLESQFNSIGRPPVTPELFLDDNVGAIAADPELLSKALASLLLRSRDSMPAGGTLTIRTGQHKGFVRVEVSDTGTGLTPEECTRLFTPYYAAGAQAAGLGLATAQSVVSDHGGRISVESVPGAGTTFRVLFPVVPRTVRLASPLLESKAVDGKIESSPAQDQPSDVAAPPLSFKT